MILVITGVSENSSSLETSVVSTNFHPVCQTTYISTVVSLETPTPGTDLGEGPGGDAPPFDKVFF